MLNNAFREEIPSDVQSSSSFRPVLLSCGFATGLLKSVLESSQQLHHKKTGLDAMLEPSLFRSLVHNHFPTLLFMVVLKHLNTQQQQPDSFKTGEVCSLQVWHGEFLTRFFVRRIISWELKGCLATSQNATYSPSPFP